MKSKVGLIILIILIIVAASFAVVIASGGISISGGNKVTIMGTVGYNMVTGWSVSYDDCLVEEDGFLAVLWYLPWETTDIEVNVELSNGKTYSSSAWTDKLNLIAGSTGFNVDIRHVSDGSYTGRIYVYEVEKGFLWGEKSRVLQAICSFEVSV